MARKDWALSSEQRNNLERALANPATRAVSDWGRSKEGVRLMWGKLKENGIWFARTSQYRLMFLNHDALYLALGRFRLRIMKW